MEIPIHYAGNISIRDVKKEPLIRHNLHPDKCTKEKTSKMPLYLSTLEVYLVGVDGFEPPTLCL